ncbi:MAG: hypothetical protein DRP02_07540 [Candidatus Gerdarchaeota archaeon]|nr:MAG: hypothetical protein DRP02_07540 [Candidatus Gerdarchaeota archaeon]
MIDCYDVIKIYANPETNVRIAALRGIDLNIKKGEVVSIIGPSGSGKSTLIKILAGMESISSGEVFVEQYELGALSDKELLEYRLRMVGLVHQFPERTLFLTGTVFDNLLFASSLQSASKKENKLHAKEILESLGIDHLTHRRVSSLSGGEMIRTAIACMIAKNAPLLLCDEPTGQLDSENTEIVKKMLREIARDFGTTVLVVTHDIRFLKGVDRFCEIQSGRVSALMHTLEDLRFYEQTFPLKFKSQIDSSQNVRIPNQIYRVMQLKNQVEFELHEDSTVVLKHPEGIPPKKATHQEVRKQKFLEIKTLPRDYFATKTITVALRNVSKVYGSRNNPVHALSKVSVDIHEGEMVFIIGPSGSGKTTAVKLITGIEPVSSGTIKILNYELQKMNESQRSRFRRENIGIVSQQGDLHPYITVAENLFLKDLLSGKTIKPQQLPVEQIDSFFEPFQITHRKDSFPLEISGGELQRASLAIAQYGSPELLILDEPTANMDAELAEIAMNQLYQFHHQQKKTLIITTHDINLVRDGTRVIELVDGKVNQDGLAYAIEK